MWLKKVFGFFCKNPDGLIVASSGMKKECVRHFFAPPSRVAVIPNSIDSNDIRRKAVEGIDIEIPPNFQLISTSGRLEKEKNLPFLLKAFSIARKHGKFKLIIIGDGTERENLRRLAREIGIYNDVIFTGYQENPYKFIKRSDLFVHTCLFEGFANSIIEAMACGVPVIALDCPYGPSDIIKHRVNGFLVPTGDEMALVDILLEITGDRELRNLIVKKGVERANDFSLENMVREYEDFFSRIIGII